MKSQKIRIRNLPDDPKDIEKLIQLKPTILLILLLAFGLGMMIFKPYMLLTGFTLLILAGFALAIMPDGRLLQIRHNYLVLYNNPGTDLVTLVYYDEIVDWYYEWHSYADDLLVLNLEDGTTETQQMYSRWIIARALHMHAPGKERKNRRKQ